MHRDRGQDYGERTGTVTSLAGSANGPTQPIVVPIRDDQIYDGPEGFAGTLATPVGANLGALSARTVTRLRRTSRRRR